MMKNLKMLAITLIPIFVNSCFAFILLYLYDNYSGTYTPSAHSFPVCTVPSEKIQQLMYVRGAIFGFMGLVSIIGFIFLASQPSFHLGSVSKSATLIFIFVIGVILVSTSIENPLRFICCCGDGPRTEWGFPYAWVMCNSESFCGVRNFNLFALTANFIFGVNVTVFIIGCGAIINKVRLISLKEQKVV